MPSSSTTTDRQIRGGSILGLLVGDVSRDWVAETTRRIAERLGRGERHTLVINLHLGCGRLDQLLCGERGLGVTDLLEGHLSLPEVVRSSEDLGFLYLAAGTTSIPDPQLLASRRLWAMIKKARDMGGRVILLLPARTVGPLPSALLDGLVALGPAVKYDWPGVSLLAELAPPAPRPYTDEAAGVTRSGMPLRTLRAPRTPLRQRLGAPPRRPPQRQRLRIRLPELVALLTLVISVSLLGAELLSANGSPSAEGGDAWSRDLSTSESGPPELVRFSSPLADSLPGTGGRQEPARASPVEPARK